MTCHYYKRNNFENAMSWKGWHNLLYIMVIIIIFWVLIAMGTMQKVQIDHVIMLGILIILTAMYCLKNYYINNTMHRKCPCKGKCTCHLKS